MVRWIHSVDRRELAAEGLVLAAAVVIAVMSARPFAGSWNDGSRLASVESLVDRRTWKIDRSTFVQVPRLDCGTPLPYDPSSPGLLLHGTLDKLYINGHYYSDKSPVPALLMACEYQLWQSVTGWTAREQPGRFCWRMTLLSSGLAYLIAVWCIFRLGRVLLLPLSWRLLFTASFALATVALPYVRHVNNHMLLLGISSALTLGLARVLADGRVSWRGFASLGTLAGLAYTIDLGVGPVILLCTSLLILNCSFEREPVPSAEPHARLRLAAKRAILFGLSALPWLLLHHELNYAIGGTFKPANANPDYFRWPGSPFAVGNLTGRWVHNNPLSFLVYAASMIVGKRGFLGHNLPLFLTLPAWVILWRNQRQYRRELLWAAACCIGTWLLYAATSNNSSGQCCSIRWFVPLLAPAYYVLAMFLRSYPQHRIDFLILSGWGLLVVLLMREGPWMAHMVPLFWPIQAVALGSLLFRYYLYRRSSEWGRVNAPCFRTYSFQTYSITGR